MATINTQLLDAALEDGYLKKKNVPRWAHPSVQTAQMILTCIKIREGIGSDQIASQTGLAVNTVRQFLSWLEENHLISGQTTKEPGAPILWFAH